MPWAAASSSAVAASRAGRAPVSTASRAAGGRRQLAPLSSSRSANHAGSQRTSASTAGMDTSVGGAGQHHPATLGCRPHQRRRGQPAAQRLLTRGEAGALDQRPGVEQQGGGVAAGGDRLGARGRDDQARPGRDGLEHRAGAGALDRDPGERAAELFGGAPGADDRRAQPVAAAGRAAEAGLDPAAPAAGRRALRPGQPERARRTPCSGPGGGSPGRTARAGSHGAAPARAPARARGPPWRCARRWSAGGRRDRRVAVGVVPLAGDPHRRHGPAQGLAGGLDRGQRPAGDEVGDGHRPAEPGGQHRGAVHPRPGEQHLTHVRVGRARLVEQVVAVVPPGHQAEVVHRGEGRGPGADDHLGVAAQRLEVGRVARLRPLVGGEPGVPARPEHLEQRRLDPHDVAVVGHDEHGTAAALDRGPGGLGEQHRPVGGAGHRRHGEQRRGGGAARRRGGPGTPARRRTATRPAAPARAAAGARAPRRARRLLGRGVPRGHREPQHVAERPGVPVGDRPGRGEHLRGQHRLGRHHPAQRAEPAEVLGVGPALEHEPVEVLPGEAHLDPHARRRGLGHRRGHGVLERPVEVRQPGVDLHQRHRHCSVVGSSPASRADGAPRGRARAARAAPPHPSRRRRHGPETSGAHRPGRGRWARAVDDGAVSPRPRAAAPRPGRCAPR